MSDTVGWGWGMANSGESKERDKDLTAQTSLPTSEVRFLGCGKRITA